MRPSRRIRPAALVLLGLLSSVPFAGRAADIYVLEALMERDGRSSVSPTFIVTPGERALLVFEGESELDVAMTLVPRDAGAGSASDASSDAFDLRVELVDGVELHDETVPVSLAETETLELGGRTIKVLVRVQEALEVDAPAATDEAADEGG